MQYVKKQNQPPTDWDSWFTKSIDMGGAEPEERRSYDYRADNSSLRNLPAAKQFLIDEQHGLCAYCQQKITIENASIEHVIPKEFNKELSTNYYNLIAVCKTQEKDLLGKLHCDKAKGSQMISPIIFISNAETREESGKIKNNAYFEGTSDGSVAAKSNTIAKQQIESFIEITNLNHGALKALRKAVLDGIIQASVGKNKRKFLEIEFDRIYKNKQQPFRQFLLVYIGNKLGY